MLSSRVKISPLLWLHNRSRLSHQKTIKVKWFGSSLVLYIINRTFREIFFNSRREILYLRAAMFIYGKQGRIMENLISVSVGLNSGMLFKKI